MVTQGLLDHQDSLESVACKVYQARRESLAVMEKLEQQGHQDRLANAVFLACPGYQDLKDIVDSLDWMVPREKWVALV